MVKLRCNAGGMGIKTAMVKLCSNADGRGIKRESQSNYVAMLMAGI